MADAPVVTAEPPVPSRIPDILRRTRPWVRLLAILYLLVSIFMIVVGIGGAALFSFLPLPNTSEMGSTRFAPTLAFLFYPVVGLINLIPAILLLRFAKRSKTYIQTGHMADLESALDAQRGYWKFMGILALIGIGCAVLAMLAGIVAALWFARAAHGG